MRAYQLEAFGLSGPNRVWRNKGYRPGRALTHVANTGVESQPRANLLEVERLAAGHRRVRGGCARRRSEGHLAWATLAPSVKEAIPSTHLLPRRSA